MVSEMMCCSKSLMIEYGAFSHRIDYVTLLSNYALKETKKIKRLSEHFSFSLGYNAKTIVF